MITIEDKFIVGDHVTRAGDDVHIVTYLTEDCHSGTFLCIVAPLDGWCKEGDIENNLCSRYSKTDWK